MHTTAETSAQLTPATLKSRVGSLRLFSVPVSAGPVILATAATVPGGITNWHWPVLIAAALGTILLHLAGNLLNDY